MFESMVIWARFLKILFFFDAVIFTDYLLFIYCFNYSTDGIIHYKQIGVTLLAYSVHY